MPELTSFAACSEHIVGKSHTTCQSGTFVNMTFSAATLLWGIARA